MENGRGNAISSASTSIDEPGAMSRTSRAHTHVSGEKCISLFDTSSSPEPALRKISRRPLTGSFEGGATMRKNVCTACDDEGCPRSTTADAAMAAISKTRRHLGKSGMYDLNE